MIFKNCEKKEDNTAVISVESDAAEFESAVNGAYKKNKNSINVPGFRKGKAPRAVIEGMYGKEVFYQDALDELAQPAFDLGIKESGVKYVGRPSIASVDVTEDRTAAFGFSVVLYPEVTLGQYKGLTAEVEAVTVSDEDVDKEIESTRKKNARMISVDDRAAQKGDTVNIDFDGFLNGERFDGGKSEGYELELGSGSFVPGFEEQVEGMQIGEEKDLDVTFPENYDKKLAGKAVVFKVKLNEITYPELPELDDDFAKDVSEYDTFAEYKESVKAELTKKREEQAEDAKRSEIIKSAVDNMTVSVPEVMVAEKVEEIVRNYAAQFGMNPSQYSFEDLTKMMGLDANTINSSLRPGAEYQVKSDLLLEAVANAEALEPTDEETAEFVKKLSTEVGASEEDIKKYFGDEYIAAEWKKEKAQSIIVESAVITVAAPKTEEAASEQAE